MALLDYFTGDITLDENTRTELIDAFPNLMNDVELNKHQKLTKEYVNQKLIPELLKLKDHQQIQKLKVALDANNKLKALVSQFAFAPLPAGTMPSGEDTMDNIKDSVDSAFQDFIASSKKLLWIESAEEKKAYLTQQIVFRANRARAAMDKTLKGASDWLTHWGGKSWDGNYYGPHGGPINKAFVWNDVGELDQTASDGSFPEVQEEIGNYDKDSVEKMIARVVEQSVRNDKPNASGQHELTVVDGLTESYENKEQQMKAALEWLYAVEAGWEQNRDYISFSAKWVKDNAVELWLGTLGSLGIGAIMILLAAAWWVKKFGGALSHIPWIGLIKKLWPVLAKIPKYWPIIWAVGAIIPSAKPDPLKDFKPDTEPKHKALQDIILDEMWKTDKATQDKVINDIWTRESATLTWAWVNEANFKAEIRNTASTISTTYPALRTEFETKVWAVQGWSTAANFEEYKKSVLEWTDMINEWEYKFRAEKALKAQAKWEKWGSQSAQQQAQVEEWRAVAGDIKHPKNRIRTTASRIPWVNPPPILKPDPTSHLTPSEAITRAKALRKRAELLEVTEIELADKTKIKMTKLDGKTLTALEGLEATIANAEIEKKKIQDKIDVAADRMLKEQKFTTLSGNVGVIWSIEYQKAEKSRLDGIIGADDKVVTDTEKDSRYQEKGKFSKSKLTWAELTAYENAVRNLATNRPILATVTAKITADQAELDTISKERAKTIAKTTYKTESEIKAYIWQKSAWTAAATWNWAEIEVQDGKIKAAIAAMETHYTDIANRYSNNVKFDPAKRLVTIDNGLPIEIKKAAAKMRWVLAKS
jgi:hypothetical protein